MGIGDMVVIKNSCLVGFVGALLVLLPGCGSSLYYGSRDLHDLTVVSAHQWISQDNVTLLSKRFDKQDNKYYFNKSNIPYVVFQLTIHNQSLDEWVLTKEYINIPVVGLQDVIKKLSPSYMRSVGMQMLVGAPLASVYSLRQLDSNNRIVQDVATKTVDQPINIAPGQKKSVVLFIKNRDLKSCLSIRLGHAIVPGKCLTFELPIV